MQSVAADIFGMGLDVKVLLRQIDQDGVIALHYCEDCRVVCLNLRVELLRVR